MCIYISFLVLGLSESVNHLAIFLIIRIILIKILSLNVNFAVQLFYQKMQNVLNVQVISVKIKNIC